jgi:3-deoxy-7-phosphoheptulonate synthase
MFRGRRAEFGRVDVGPLIGVERTVLSLKGTWTLCLPQRATVAWESEPTTMGTSTHYDCSDGGVRVCLTGQTNEASDKGSEQVLKPSGERERRRHGVRPGMRRVSDLNIASNVPMPAPALMLHEIPRMDAQGDFVAEARQHIRDIIMCRDPRFLLIVGPCSIHDTRAGLEYAARLRRLIDRVRERVFVVMRCYFEKPRTTIGWKGLIMDPRLDGSDDIPEGMRIARRFLRDVIDAGVPTATELLDPITPQYIADLICWSAIGARTTESQTHRQMASGLSMPLGFKNATTGNIDPAVNAIKAAREPQTFLGISADGVASAVSTTGNPDCHVVLRGGDSGPNYSPEHVAETERRLDEAGLGKGIVIDCSHGNSRLDYNRQGEVLRNVVAQRVSGTASIIGAMLESNLMAGNQPFPEPSNALVYGRSITDACIDWPTTERLVLEVAESGKAPPFSSPVA